MSFFKQNSNNYYMKNKILQTDINKNKEELRNTSIEASNSYRRRLFQRAKPTNRFIQNNNVNFPQKNFEIENKKTINIYSRNNNYSNLNNIFNKTEGNSQISFNNSKRDINIKENLTNTLSHYNINQKPIRVESTDNLQNKNVNNSNFNTINDYSNHEFYKSKSTSSYHKRNLIDENSNNEITKSDYIKIMEKFSKLVIQIEDYQKMMKELKDENEYLKSIISRNNNSNNINYKDLKNKNDNSHYLQKIELLNKQLNSLNKEYESYKKLTETRLNCFKDLYNKNEINKQISKLKSENLNLKNDYNQLLQKYEHSNRDYDKLLSRNESLNREIFQLRTYVSSKKLINPFQISYFSLEIKSTLNKIKLSYKKGDLSKRINTVLLSKKNNNLVINNNNFEKKLTRENSSQAEIMISTLESQNNSLINKVQKLEDQFRGFLKTKSGRNRRLEQCKSWSKS